MRQKWSIIIGVITILVAAGFIFWQYKMIPQPPSPSVDPQNTTITLQRTTCFGTCPDYSLTIHGDGRVEYKGNNYVKVTGLQTSRISPEQVKQLVDEFYQANYFSLQDEYTALITDLPTTVTSITIDGKTKKVSDYYGAPEKLIKLEDKIDEVTNSKQWVGKCTLNLDEIRCTDS